MKLASRWRADFPIFAAHPGLHYLDAAATAYEQWLGDPSAHRAASQHEAGIPVGRALQTSIFSYRLFCPSTYESGG